MKIVPAILTDSPRELEKMVRQSESFTDWAQIDIMDGRFVPSHSITAADLAAVLQRCPDAVLSLSKELVEGPKDAMRTDLKVDAHLMVNDPAVHFADFKKAGARKITFHFEATPSPQEAIARARHLGLEVAVALNPETPLSALMPLLPLVDSVLFLTVNPGFYGSPFIPEVLDKIKDLRARGPGARIGVDGGIKADNIALVASYGVDYICVGSAIFKQADPAASFLDLRRKLGLVP